MIIFNAGNCRLKGSEELIYKCCGAGKNRLFTFAEYEELKAHYAFLLNPEFRDKRFFLDSGAFSAFSRGAEIDLGKYCDFIEEYRSELYCYSNLDVIGDYRATRLNYEAIRARGLSPMGVFHYGSPWSELERYCEEGCQYLALGGLVPYAGRRAELRVHLDKCWTTLRKYWPIKVHAFGITSQWVLERYPFFSADSTVAVVGGGMGRVLEFVNGKMSSRRWQAVAGKGKFFGLVDNLDDDGSHHMVRRFHNLKQIEKFQNHINKLWEHRGVVCEE